MSEITEETGTLPEEQEALEPTASAEQESESAPEQEQEPEQDKVQKRIDELTREKYEARRAAEQARKQVEDLQNAIALSAGAGGEQFKEEDIQAFVRQEAQRLKQEDSFNEACNLTYERGIKDFPDFEKSLQNLHLVGVNRDFLELVSTTDVGDKILHHLGKDLGEAERVLKLPPIQMARELTRLETKLASQKKQTSNAPEPIKHITGSSKSTKSPADMSNDEYLKWRRSGR